MNSVHINQPLCVRRYLEGVDISKYRNIPVPTSYLAYYIKKAGNQALSREYYQKAAKELSDYCFLHRLDEILVLQEAIKVNTQDSKAPYYLGNLLDSYVYQLINNGIAVAESSKNLRSPFLFHYAEKGRWY